jgi:exportin-1
MESNQDVDYLRGSLDHGLIFMLQLT